VNDLQLIRDKLQKRTAPKRVARNPCLNPKFFPPIDDQGNIGSCTGSITNAQLYKLRERNLSLWKKYKLSRLYAYWRGREKEESIPEDSGCYIRDVVWASSKFGIAREDHWPYVTSRFADTPPKEAHTAAKWHQTVAYYRCDTPGEDVIQNMRIAIASGLPLIYGFTCYTNLGEADDDGIVPEPNGKVDGGHCVLGFEMDDDNELVWGPNSWGAWGGQRHGQHGWIAVPYSAFRRGWADDIWAIDHE